MMCLPHRWQHSNIKAELLLSQSLIRFYFNKYLINFQTLSRQSESKMESFSVEIFRDSLKSLDPKCLLNSSISIDHEKKTLFLLSENQSVSLQRDCYLIGFGKAVLGVASVLAEKLCEVDDIKIKGGILSVPSGISCLPGNKELIETCSSHNVIVKEGAKNNLPDTDSQETAEMIINLVKNLQKEDVVFVVISGGGSSLLPLPTPDISLEEKLGVVNLLSRGGVSITQLNTVRKTLSSVKEMDCKNRIVHLAIDGGRLIDMYLKCLGKGSV